ncbi:accessory Sec system protein Asp3 [Cellulomonas denverensis]|uniref:accessory Sec system protein Asp3 n=1 Tax=Cellulomonas denverensis TaxID=264297 RepID=UPI0035E72811
MRSAPPDTVIVEIRYFDRFDTVLRTDILHPPEYAFDYPADCRHYTIRLLNGGCDEVWFDSFTLLDAEVTRRG